MGSCKSSGGGVELREGRTEPRESEHEERTNQEGPCIPLFFLVFFLEITRDQ